MTQPSPPPGAQADTDGTIDLSLAGAKDALPLAKDALSPPRSSNAIELSVVTMGSASLSSLSPTLGSAVLEEAADDEAQMMSLPASSEGRSSFATSSSRSSAVCMSPFTTRSRTPRQIMRELTIEVLPALLVSVAGSVLAGYILGQIQDSPAFKQVPALFIMATVLLNLKSNIELNMSARLSTLANLGVFDDKEEGIRAMRSNMELLLLQSTIVGASVGLISSVLSLLPGKRATGDGFWEEAAVLMASGIGCSVVGGAVIGSLVILTVSASHACGVDPDNIGTPIAASFGDMSTLLILGGLASVLVHAVDTPWPLLTAVGFGIFGVFLLRIVRENHQMAHHFGRGWLPLVYAAVTSSAAGVIVEKCASRFPGMPALVPVINGIGGNIGTVFASRVSTSLHRNRGSHDSEHRLVMVVLLVINIPVQVAFLAMRRFVDPALTVSPGFLLAYTAATVVHGLAVLVLGRAACTYLWARGYDPDDYVNPFVTGTGDMLGTFLLAVVFIVAGGSDV
ncbi:hypothetical protein LPJ61_002142 [Coemansia biformis]|uniref:SLC41A/MgtE integral membrane domain-containing protein n=1 Tax=Coemansia biformis TaxID=1286918 RepID=A0A9W7YDW0_9FUNG|nr:hypothetical protein LPJ61_002142 [Coemansia biformis]